MTRQKTFTTKAFLTLAFIAMALPLGGCESVDNAMHGMKDRISAIQMPRFGSTENEEQQPQDTVAEAVAASDSASQPGAFAPAMMEGGLSPDTQTTARITTVTEGKDCPPVTIVEDLAALHQFTNPDRPTPTSRISSVVLKDLRTNCARNENNVAVELNLTFEGKLGPHGRVKHTDEPSFAYPYFVAITTKDGNIVAKEVFATTITYRPEDETTLDYENMRQIIPLTGDYATDYEILVGFQLTEGELAYNRALSEGPVPSEYVPEHYIESSTASAAATAKPMTVIPATKPPVPVTAKAPEPEPKPEPALAAEPAPVAQQAEPAENELDKIIEKAVQAAPAPTTIVAPVAADQPQAPAFPQELPQTETITTEDNAEIITIEEAAPSVPEAEAEATIESELEEITEEKTGEAKAILEENAIIPAKRVAPANQPVRP